MAKVHASSCAAPALDLWKCIFALVGILALLSMMTLATWHDALPHIDGIEHAHAADGEHHQQASGHDHDHASGHHRHDGDGDDHSDGKDVIHLGAHAVSQSMDIPAQPVVGMSLIAAMPLWIMAPADYIDSIGPDSLLRPPRA